MAARPSRGMKTKASNGSRSSLPQWSSLSWGDVTDWAGHRSVTRGRVYQSGGRVRDLVLSEDGRVLATVAGGQRYATSVWWEAEALRSRCTCPVGENGCKHAVAVVAAYLDMLAKNTPVPIAKGKDARWAELARDIPRAPHHEYEYGDESNYFDDSEESNVQPTRRPRSGKGAVGDEKIRKYIASKSHEELAAQVWSLAERFPEVLEDLREQMALGEGKADRLIAAARKELRRATAKPGWRDSWEGEGFTPDFGRLARYLDRMIELGHADSVVKLSREILALGMEQVEQSSDEGETAGAFSECLAPVFRAVQSSSLTPAKKLLFAIDAKLKDDCGAIDSEMLDTILKGEVGLSDWSAVADQLIRRLKADTRTEGNHHDKYQRERSIDWLARALTCAGRDEELITVREREASIHGAYDRLVVLLVERKRYDDAERWAAEGIRKSLRELPGMANQLANVLGEIARQRRQWKVVAAHAARAFFDRPGREGFAGLVDAAKRAGCQEWVERLALEFLETGKLPFSIATGKDGARKATIRPDWPLPLPEHLLLLMRTGEERPHYDVLIDLAIAETRPDDVLAWYDLWCAATKGQNAGWFYGASHAEKVAVAVTKSHPDRALELYRGLVDANLKRAEIPAYEAVAAYLKKMRPILKSMDQGWVWNEMVAGIRVNYRNRPRFMEILDLVEARPILRK